MNFFPHILKTGEGVTFLQIYHEFFLVCVDVVKFRQWSKSRQFSAVLESLLMEAKIKKRRMWNH